MPDNSFDVVSEVSMPEVLNAVQQAMKEVIQRFDLKDSKSDIQLNEKEKQILITSIDEFKLKAVVDVLESKLLKRKVSLKALEKMPIQPAAGSTVRQEIKLQDGDPDREGSRDREGDQRQQEEGAGIDQWGTGAHQRPRSRCASGSDGPAARTGFRDRHAVHQSALELSR